MTKLASSRFTTADLPALMDKLTRNSIGMDEHFDRLFNLHETNSNYQAELHPEATPQTND